MHVFPFFFNQITAQPGRKQSSHGIYVLQTVYGFFNYRTGDKNKNIYIGQAHFSIKLYEYHIKGCYTLLRFMAHKKK